MMYPAYDDATEKYRFECRYMAFIDLDEFIFPKTNQSIVEVTDEILSPNPKTQALAVSWKCFGSNGEEKADYSRGVLERFTRRAPHDWVASGEDSSHLGSNIFIKSVMNPRGVDYFSSPHFASYFSGLKSINSNGTETWRAGNHPVLSDKIVVNHYFTKSKEEYAIKKMPKGSVAVKDNYYDMKMFDFFNRNEVFDDGILKYRAARADSFVFETDAERLRRVEKALIEILTQCSPFDAPAEFFIGKLETFLTCRALAEKFGTKIGNKTAEEYALVWIYQAFNKDRVLTYADLQLFLNVLPELLARPFPLCKKIFRVFASRIVPVMCETARNFQTWESYKELRLLQRLLNSI